MIWNILVVVPQRHMAEDEKRLRSVKNLLEWSVEQQGDECRKDLKPISKDVRDHNQLINY